MSENWILIFKIVSGSGAFAALCLTVRYIWIALIQKDNDKLVELRQEADGTKQLTIKGYSREDQAKIVKQLNQGSTVIFPALRNGRGTSVPTLKS